MSGIRLLFPLPKNNRGTVLIWLSVAGWCTHCFCFSLPPERRQAASSAIEKMIASDYNGAILLCDSIIKADREDPMGQMLRLSAIGLHDLDLDSATDSLNFFDSYKKVDASIFNYEKKYGVSSYTCTVKGFAKAIAAAYNLWHKKYFAGLDMGFAALSSLQEAKRLDNTNTDVDFFLGLYTYARADLKRNFWWAFFWYSGDKNAGIRSIRACSRNAQFARQAATLLLAEIYYRENKIPESDTITRSLLATYPASRLTLWTCAKRGEATQSFADAAASYQALADAYDGIGRARRNALVTRSKAAHMYFSAGDTLQTRTACENIFAKKKGYCDSFCRQICGDVEKLLVKMRKTR
jgi:hypothetical protein